MKSHILLVEDNLLTAKGLTYLLEHEGYKVEVANGVNAALECDLESISLALLDVNLPDGNGFDLARELAEVKPNLPMIFLTARDEEADIIKGLELGAKDYITKPFRNRELLLRIKNHLQPAHLGDKGIITAGTFRYDSKAHQLFVEGNEVILTALEDKIFSCLLASHDQIVTRERLLDEIWDASGKIVNDNTLSVYLKRLRSKLNLPGAIQTVKNLGYRLNTGERTK